MSDVALQAVINFAGAVEGRGRFPAVKALGETNLRFVPHLVSIVDSRSFQNECELDVHGFCLVPHRSRVARLRELETLADPYHQEMCQLLGQVLGASEVLPDRAGLVLRLPEAIGPEAHPPVAWAHMDYTEHSAVEFRDLFFGDGGSQVSPFRRWGIFQTWRVTSPPPQDTLLAVTDGRSVIDGQWVVFDGMRGPPEIPGNVWEARLAKADDRMQWCYFSEMQVDEVLIFKAFDSDPSLHRNVFHSAFTVPYPPGVTPLPRSSIEGRYFAFFE